MCRSEYVTYLKDMTLVYDTVEDLHQDIHYVNSKKDKIIVIIFRYLLNYVMYLKLVC